MRHPIPQHIDDMLTVLFNEREYHDECTKLTAAFINGSYSYRDYRVAVRSEMLKFYVYPDDSFAVVSSKIVYETFLRYSNWHYTKARRFIEDKAPSWAYFGSMYEDDCIDTLRQHRQSIQKGEHATHSSPTEDATDTVAPPTPTEESTMAALNNTLPVQNITYVFGVDADKVSEDRKWGSS